MQIQTTNGSVYEVTEHKLSSMGVETNFGPAEIIGIRADAQDAREVYAFVVRFKGGYIALMSRRSFSITSTA